MMLAPDAQIPVDVDALAIGPRLRIQVRIKRARGRCVSWLPSAAGKKMPGT